MDDDNLSLKMADARRASVGGLEEDYKLDRTVAIPPIEVHQMGRPVTAEEVLH